jgi:hypothetical protein
MKGFFSTSTKEEIYLDFYVENTTFARFNDGVDSLFASTVKVAGEFGMLDETAMIEKGDEVVTRDEMVLHAIGLSWSGGAGGI